MASNIVNLRTAKQMRKYIGPMQFFHNFQHDVEGRTHCNGPQSNPWSIEHSNGKHIITSKYARGHGRGKKPQWFQFTEKLKTGYDLRSAIKIATEKVPDSFKTLK